MIAIWIMDQKLIKIFIFILSFSFVQSQSAKLIWSDEFNGDGSVNSANWFHQTKLPNGWSWYNGEIQHYTARTNNSYVSNGTLKIVAKKEVYSDQGHTKQYTSARLNSKFAFTYGRVEIRAKLPQGAGTWPAIWLLGKNINESGAYWQTKGFGSTSWPACGEVDIMEHWGSNQNYVQSAIHTPSSHGNTINHGGQNITNASTDFHVYSLDWSKEKMIFSVDGNVHYVYEPRVKNKSTWPFDSEQYLLLNIAIIPGISSSFNESKMEIDYVRIYEDNLGISVGSDQTPKVFKISNVYPNPFNGHLTIPIYTESIIDGTIDIIDVLGKRVDILFENHSFQDKKQIKIHWNPNGLSSGTYFIRAQTEKEVQLKKVSLIK